METELDPVVRLLEEGTDIVESLNRLPLVSIHQVTTDDPVVEGITGGETDATVEQTLRERGGSDDELEEGEHPGLSILDCHADTIQLIRARFRLTNLAYQCLRFKRTHLEELQRYSIQTFLNRRYQDSTILATGGSEKWTLTDRAQHVFKQARIILREEAFKYMRHNQLSAPEQLRVMQLVAFFESFKLRWQDADHFFNPCSELDNDWDFSPSLEEYTLLNLDPAAFCKNIQISAEYKSVGNSLSYDSAPSVRIDC
ncbi:MAG: hypothetical protein Q9213_002778 [Squamulea squamosa]